MKHIKQKMCLCPVSCLAPNHFRQSGQAVIETVFVVFMIMWILMFVLQLFQITDKAIFVMTNVQKIAREAIRLKDTTDEFKLMDGEDMMDCRSVAFLPGVEWAAIHYPYGCRKEDPPSFPIKRQLAAFGGSLQRGSNQYYANHWWDPYYGPTIQQGRRSRVARIKEARLD